MLQSIRDHTQGWIAGVIVSLLILSFALWGIHSYLESGGGSSTVAKVNGTEITRNQLSSAYERIRRELQFEAKSNPAVNFTDKGLKEQALQSLINIQVLKEGSLDQNYRISSNQIDNNLVNIPQFQVNGHFSAQRFQQLLDANLFTAGDFLEFINTKLLIEQPRLGIVLSSFALPNEVDTMINLVNQERDVKYLVLPIHSISQETIKISPEEVQAYYNEHQNEFKTPEQISIEYLELTLKDVMANIHPNEEALKKFYKENSGSYNQPFEKIKSQVLTDYTRQQGEEKFAEQREQLANITYEHPESLSLAAQSLGLKVKTSEMFSKNQGGKDVSSHDKVREIGFSDEVLIRNNNSDVVQISPDDVIVMRIKNHKPATVLSLSTVAPQITDKLKLIEVDKQLNHAAQETKNKLQQGKLNGNLKWIDVGFLGRQSNKINSAILNTAFALPKPDSHLSYGIAKIPEGYVVVAVKSVRVAANGNKQDQTQFADQYQIAQGLLEYELYKQSLINQAKIYIENQ